MSFLILYTLLFFFFHFSRTSFSNPGSILISLTPDFDFSNPLDPSFFNCPMTDLRDLARRHNEFYEKVYESLTRKKN